MDPKYFDYAASTALLPEVKQAMEQADAFYANPSAQHLFGREAATFIEKHRQELAAELQVKPQEIYYMAGATEANNLALRGAVNHYGGRPACVMTEHDSVIRTVEAMGGETLEVERATGQVKEDAIINLPDDVVVFSLALVNNETGVVADMRRVRKLLAMVKESREGRGIDLPLLLHTDASQAGLYTLSPRTHNADLATYSSKSLYGPSQAAVLFVSRSVQLKPDATGGSQENGYRPGTQSAKNIAGVSTALRVAVKERAPQLNQLETLNEYLVEGIESLGGSVVLASEEKSPHVLMVVFEGVDNEELMHKLSQRGFAVGIGSACHASSKRPSRALEALAISRDEQRSSIRLSIGRYTTRDSIKDLLANLEDLLVG
ncbi:MAG: aminotransferase class V-fold PLP-dependent enzyme [Patescibacteria group bacterium]